MNQDIKYYLKECAHDSMGIYPMASTDKHGIRTERTPWQDGWNAHSIELRKKECQLHDWYDTLDDRTKNYVLYLLENDVLMLKPLKDGSVNTWVLLNDVFYPAADGEDVTIDELDKLVNIHMEFGWDGIVAWFAIKGSIEPRPGHFGEKYQEAKKYLIT